LTRAHYMSRRANYTLRLKSPKKIFINDVMQRKPGLRAVWHDHNLVTENPEIIKMLDELLTGTAGHIWQRKFYKVPSAEVISKVSETQKRIRAMEQEELNKSMTKKQREEFEGWRDFLARQKAKQPQHIEGTRAHKTDPVSEVTST
jgi:hypothetical protein